MGFLFVKLQRAVIPMALELYGMVINCFEFGVFYTGHQQHTLGIGKSSHHQPALSY